MDRHFVTITCLVALTCNILSGCMVRKPGLHFQEDLAHLRQLAQQTQYDDVHEVGPSSAAVQSGPPRLLTDMTPADFWPMTPEEAVQYAITNSTVLRDLGATVLRSPDRIRTIHNPALQETDPRFGVPAALAFFDAELATRMFFEKNDRAVNNRIVGQGTQIFQQDFLNWEAELKKRSMTGGQYTLRKTWEYDANNSMENIFGSAWQTLLDFEVRQPLLQGAGVGFNQVAGPESVPGVINGVRIARLNTDISLAEYQIALRDLVSNVENAYWDLYFAYRDLEAKIAARDEALQTWREFEAGVEFGGVAVDAEAQAREQYFRFQEEVQIALGGRLIEGTEVNTGSPGGTFRGSGAGQGVLVAERRLRLIMGLPINDGRVIRPAYDPQMVKVVFDWDEVLTEGITRRAELQRQRTELRRLQLQLIANRNFLLPRFDAFGRYRFRGLGEMLIDRRNTTGGVFNMQDEDVGAQFDNAYQNLTTGNFQEWQLGFEFALPVGFRRAHAAVRHAQLQLARGRAVLNEQERQVVFDLSNAYAEVVRAFEVMQTAYNRRIAAKENYEALDERLKFEKDRQANANLLLDAQRRLADAESRFYRAQVDYMLAVKNVHYEKGSLLDYNEVYVVGDHGRPPEADSASLRKWQRGRPFDYLLTRPRQQRTPRVVPPGGEPDGNGPDAEATQYAGHEVELTEDGNVIPRDGWPMVRLPQVALPDVQLPSLDNLALPAGPSSPAQVLPTVASRLEPMSRPTVARPSRPDPFGTASPNADSDRSATVPVPTEASEANTSRPRPTLRLPFRSTRTAAGTETADQTTQTDQGEPSERGRRDAIRVEVVETAGLPARPPVPRKPDYRFPGLGRDDDPAEPPPSAVPTTAARPEKKTETRPETGTRRENRPRVAIIPEEASPVRSTPPLQADGPLPNAAATAQQVAQPARAPVTGHDARRSQLEPAQANLARTLQGNSPQVPQAVMTGRFLPRPGAAQQAPPQQAPGTTFTVGAASQLQPARAAASGVPGHSSPSGLDGFSRPPAMPRPAVPATGSPAPPSLGKYISANANQRPKDQRPKDQRPKDQRPIPPKEEPEQRPLLRMLFGTDDDLQTAPAVPASARQSLPNAPPHTAPTQPNPLFRLPIVGES